MTSTRNKNSPVEYNLQVSGNQYIDDFSLYKYSTQPVKTYFAGNGIIMPHIARDQLSYHSIDCETYLFGISSNNLVNPSKPFIPEIKHLNSLNIVPIQNNNIIMPQPLDSTNNQRPLIYK